MKNGAKVAEFERRFAEYVGAEYAIALCNGTATLHTALAALGVERGDSVAVPPLTMSATTIAVLHAGGVPLYVDVDPDTWLMQLGAPDIPVQMPVDLYGLHASYINDWRDGESMMMRRRWVFDSAQTLRRPLPRGFTSYSFQASKILPLGEGGMLVTNDEDLARRAREFSSLGYRMDPAQPRIDPAVLKHPTYARHHRLGWNYRMSDHVAERGLSFFRTCGEITGAEFDREPLLDFLKRMRRKAASFYADVVRDVPWITPQHVPDYWEHDYWCYAVALEDKSLWEPFMDAVVRHGGEMPYGAWRLTYREPAFEDLGCADFCPVAEDLQPRLVQAQTNNVESASRNAAAWAQAIREIG